MQTLWFRRTFRRAVPALALLVVALASAQVATRVASAQAWEDPGPPVLVNGAFECSEGYSPQAGIEGMVPAGWTAVLLDGDPTLNSTRIEFAGGCGEDGFIERIEGEDSLVFLSEDIETPPEPGKPFDATVYLQVTVTPGAAYSLSGWMVSLCGGSFSKPNDCPEGYYMSKMLGIDPTGGTNPLAATVLWTQDQRNFTVSRWVNLRIGATAQGNSLTIFARIRSPYRWHGNHAFVDAYSLVRAPTAHFIDLPASVQGNQTLVRWAGTQSPDIAAIPGGTYQLLFDVQHRRLGQAGWSDWQIGQPAGQAQFGGCGGETYEFRLRARSEQPAGSNGAWPNHRYPGDWSDPEQVLFEGKPCLPQSYLPMISK